MWQVVWVKTGSGSDCVCVRAFVKVILFIFVCAHVYICMHWWMRACIYTGVCPCACMCDYMKWGKEITDIQKQEIELIKEENGKKFMYAYWHSCKSPCVCHFLCVCVCASDCLWSQEKRDLYFRAYALFRGTHFHRSKHIHNKLW